MRRLPLCLFALGLAGVVACDRRADPSGAVLYRQNCAGCHGPAGAGDGRLGAGLPVPPVDLRGLAAANRGAFPSERVMASIYGYRGKDFAALMPEFGSVLDSPPVIWTAPDGREIATPSALVALADYIETLQDQ